MGCLRDLFLFLQSRTQQIGDHSTVNGALKSAVLWASCYQRLLKDSYCNIVCLGMLGRGRLRAYVVKMPVRRILLLVKCYHPPWSVVWQTSRAECAKPQLVQTDFARQLPTLISNLGLLAFPQTSYNVWIGSASECYSVLVIWGIYLKF